MTRTIIYQVNFSDKLLNEKFTLSNNEVFITRPTIRDNFVSIATNKNIMLFDPPSYRDEYQQVTPDYVIPHPIKTEHSVMAFQLADGYLLTYFGTDYFGYDRPGAQAFYAKLSGEVEYVGGREFTTHAHPAWIRESLYMISPILWGSQNILFNYIEPNQPNIKTWSEIREIKMPKQVNTLAIILHIVSVIGAIVMCRRHKLKPAQVVTWISLCAFLSLPALVACILLNPFKVESKPVPLKNPAT